MRLEVSDPMSAERMAEIPTCEQYNTNDELNDALLMGLSLTPTLQKLRRWAIETPSLHDFPIDYHRLQLEYWLWEHRAQLTGRVMDVGVIIPRRWAGPGYFTFGPGCDVDGDIMGLSPEYDAAMDAVICTEVLEHVTHPERAISEIWWALKPGGLLLVTSPFTWPWHGTADYNDYWRFTHQGWKLLLKQFERVSVKACLWTTEGLALVDMARRFEGWGFRNETQMHTGYLCEAHKGGNNG